MFDLARPGFLLAGMFAALIPLVLHLIARHPPERVPLPTLRFLRPDSRRAIRVRRRPSDLLLLLLRTILLLLLGLGFAGLAWVPVRSGTAEVVLLDRGTGRVGWGAAVDRARSLLLDAESEPRGALVLFDTVAERIPQSRITGALFDSLAQAGPAAAPPDYAVALRAIRPAMHDLGQADSIRVTLLSDRRREGWRPGLVYVRRAAWPGAIHLPELPATPDLAADARSTAAPRGTAVVLAGEGEGGFVRAALEAAGWAVELVAPTAPLPPNSAEVYVMVAPPPPSTAQALLERVREGATAIMAGEAPASLVDVLPWRTPPPESDASPGRGALVLAPDLALTGATGRVPGDATPDADGIAVWEDGRSAVTAVRRGQGCLVFAAFALEGGSLPLSPAYPTALDRFARACELESSGTASGARGTDRGPLDSGARAVLRGDERPSVVAASVVAGEGRERVDLSRWILAIALAVALVETMIAYRRKRDV